ncbi:hypothetical protein BDV06DRAFT_82679 [Aspergillus oleicola]
MLITPRTYFASQNLSPSRTPTGFSNRSRFFSLAGWHPGSADARVPEMTLIRQAGSVRVGEIIRYTLTYNPTADEVQPPPAALHVKVRNTSAIPLRAAYLHGPYTLYASCYPKSFNPNSATTYAESGSVPQFEPYLKAGGVWYARIPISWHSRPSKNTAQYNTWIIEIISQVVFSSTASVNFEVLVNRDESSLEFLSTAQTLPPSAAKLRDHWPSGSEGRQLLATKGIYSNSITLLIDDTASLWNTPHLPVSQHNHEASNVGSLTTESTAKAAGVTPKLQKPNIGESQGDCRKKIHLVVVTHGLHSNLGADMLYLKESIDAAAFQNGKPCRKERSSSAESDYCQFRSSSHISRDDHDNQDEDDEQVIVRGFPGNAARTERGIQYLGKRLAKYVLLMTYPDQPHLPHRKPKAKNYFDNFVPWGPSEAKDLKSECSHKNAGQSQHGTEECHPYRIARISFIGHSLGGLVQTYAIAYIQKHSPEFFDKIEPVNFVALATPFLGLSNENPLYVRFALDFGLVGRTGQDLGLSWTAPRVRSGWETLIGGKGDSSKSQGDAEARAKPLLRILPSGPAHEVLAKFERRTIYSNLVNDGIVPLRTSCLLFLDWKGLQRVEKARRESGIVGTMAEWGWAELTGANSKLPRLPGPASDPTEVTGTPQSILETVETTITKRSGEAALTQTLPPSPALPCSNAIEPAIWAKPLDQTGDAVLNTELKGSSPQSLSSPLSGLLSIFKANESGKKQAKILRRSQTIAAKVDSDLAQQDGPSNDHTSHDTGFNAPPRTTVFESAGDILMPPLPTIDYIVDPSSRPQTIFHDRIYHSEDIPPPKVKLQSSTLGSAQDGTASANNVELEDPASEAGLKVEEKIARAYHRGISWRKVLVRLEPDAHNNIIVRRMFANAYGWPVVQHLVDTHFRPSTSRTSQSNSEDNSQSSPHSVMATEDGTVDHTHSAYIVSNASAI